MIAGIITATLMLCFFALVIWAWQARNAPRFDEAARLPLSDESVTQCCCRKGPQS